MEVITVVNRDSESGSVLINVLLIAIVMSIFIASSLMMVNAANSFFINDINQAQAYYNANTGLLIGQDRLSTWVTGITRVSQLQSGYSDTENYPASGKQWWNVDVQESSYTHIKNSSTYSLTFKITSTGYSYLYSGNEQSKLSMTKTIQVTS